MTRTQVTIAILEIQARSKMFLVHLDKKNDAFAVAELEIMKEIITTLQDNIISQDNMTIYIAK